MRTAIFFLATASFVAVQAQDVERGAQIFKQTCAQGYCHGSGGTQGRAPKLLGRSYDGAAALKIVRDGVANTGMPGFGQRLSAAELDAVTAYVVKISGGDLATLKASASSGSSEMSADAKRGKDLFFDAQRGVNRCGTCHAMEGIGTAVGPNLAAGGPYSAAAIREGKPATARLAKLAGESIPALVVEQGSDFVRFYDLSSVPPVLRTAAKSGVSFTGGSPWRHTDAVKNYSTADLDAVAAYLKWASR